MSATDRIIDGVESAACSRRCCVPGAGARDSICVEASTTSVGYLFDGLHVRGVVRERYFLCRCVASLQMIDSMKDLRIIAQRPGNRAQPADVLRMPPSSVVSAAIAIRNERRPHGRAGVTQPVAGGGP
jgi:hypothetical protein